MADIVGRTLEVDPEHVTPEMSADDVESWTSLNHLRLITEVERRFGVRFSMDEVLGFRNLGDLAVVLAERGQVH